MVAVTNKVLWFHGKIIQSLQNISLTECVWKPSSKTMKVHYKMVRNLGKSDYLFCCCLLSGHSHIESSHSLRQNGAKL